MSIFRYPLPKLCLFVIAGILCYPENGFHMAWIFSGFFCGIGLLIILYFCKRDKNTYFIWLCFVVSFLSGISSAALHDPLRQSNHYAQLVPAGTKSLICGVVSDRLRPGIMGERYYLNTESLNQKKSVGKLLLYVKDPSGKKLQTGDRIVFRAEVKKIRKPLNPGQFNYANYLKHKKVLSSSSVNRENIIILANQKKDLFYYADQLRNTIDSRLSKSRLNKDELGVLNALILGQQQDISKDILTDYQFAGAVHILSVSGLHVGFLMFFLRFLFNLLPQNKFNRVIALISTIVILWLFAVVAGLSASVVRSVVMFSFLSISLFSNKDYSGFHGLFISMLLILWVEPDFLYDAGFQLSYLALLSILWFQPPLNKIWQPGHRVLKSVRDLATVSIAAQLGTLPLSLYYFHQFPGLFLLTNLVIVPAVGIIMAIGSLTVIWAAFADVPEVIIWLTQNSVQLLNKTINLIASIGSLRFTEIFFPISYLIAAYAFLFFVMWSWEKPKKMKLIAGIFSLMLLQALMITNLIEDSGRQEFIVFHISKKSVLAGLDGRNLTLYADSSVPENLITDYSNVCQRLSVRVNQMPDCMMVGQKKVLLIDSIGKYPTHLNPDIVIISGNPKINIDRMLKILRPKKLIADGGNYPGFTKGVRQSCKKQKIPFHATAEKGSFILTF